MRHLPLIAVSVRASITVALGLCVPFLVFASEHSPVRITGDISHEYRREKAEEGSDVMQGLTKLKFNADSYIWQPWFAQLNGQLGISYNEIESETEQTSGETVTGSANLHLLPQSRFPFEAHYDRTDSRVSGDMLGRPYVNTRHGFSQRYRNDRGDFTANAGYDRNSRSMEDTQMEEDVSETVSLGLTQKLSKHYISLNSNNQKVERRTTGEFSQQDGAVLQHRYQPDTTFSLDNMVSVIENEDRFSGIEQWARYVQYSSYGFWRPRTSALTVTGGARYYAILNEEDSGDVADMATVHAHAGLNYDFDRQLRLTASVSSDRTETKNDELRSSAQSVGMTYNSEYTPLGKYEYNWNASGFLRNRSGDENAGQQVIGQLGHNLQRRFEVNSESSLSINMGQSLSEEMDTVTDSRTRLTNTASITWQRSKHGRNTFLRLMVNDSRTNGTINDEVYQFVNLQFTSNQTYSGKSMLSGNLTIQSIRRSYEGDEDDGFNTSSSGSLVYQHREAFGIRRLHFTSDLKLNAEELFPVSLGNEEEYRDSWENRFDYMIGRLQMRASFRQSRYNGNNHRLFMFRIKRDFGG